MKKNDNNTLINNLNKEIENLEIAMRQFENGLTLLQFESNGIVPWNGKEAYDFITDGLGFADHNKKLLLNLNKCLNYLNTSVREEE